jgi:predicted transcriptional regulator
MKGRSIQMSERMYRAQLLLQQALHHRLRQIAKRENRSISEIARTLLENALDRYEQERATRLERVNALRRVAEKILQERAGRPLDLDVVELIGEEREKRLHELGDH